MKREKYLLKNIGLLTISNFGSKILNIFLVPLYTNFLTTGEYGTYDLYATTILLLMPLLSLDIVEAVMRFALDKKNDPNDVLAIGLRKVSIAIIICASLAGINRCFNFIPIFSDYWYFLILLFTGNIVYDLLSQFSRGIEKISTVAAAGFLNTLSVLIFNLFFLLFLRLGLIGYFLANSLAYIVPVTFMIIRLKIWRHLRFDRINSSLKASMYAYSSPLVFNMMAWWVNNVSDRYIITLICGVAANGIYSIAYRIPSILNALQAIFSQAWTISAIKEFDRDSGPFYSKIYQLYNCLLLLLCSTLIIFDKLIARILFAKDFYQAWKYAPFLMISVVFGSLSGVLTGIFSAAKKTKVLATTTITGAFVNTGLNFLLVHKMGPIGAAIATLFTCAVVWGMRLTKAREIVKFDITLKKDLLAYGILLLQAVLLVIGDSKFFVMILICFIVLILLYASLIKRIVTGTLKIINNKLRR